MAEEYLRDSVDAGRFLAVENQIDDSIKPIIMEGLPNIHPGEVLLAEFLTPLGISQYRLVKDLCISKSRIYRIVQGKRRITADTAIRLSKYFGTSAKFWLGLQDDYDLEEQNDKLVEALKAIPVADMNTA